MHGNYFARLLLTSDRALVACTGGTASVRAFFAIFWSYPASYSQPDGRTRARQARCPKKATHQWTMVCARKERSSARSALKMMWTGGGGNGGGGGGGGGNGANSILARPPHPPPAPPSVWRFTAGSDMDRVLLGHRLRPWPFPCLVLLRVAAAAAAFFPSPARSRLALCAS